MLVPEYDFPLLTEYQYGGAKITLIVKGRESFMLAVDTKAHVICLGGDSAQGVDLALIPATP